MTIRQVDSLYAAFLKRENQLFAQTIRAVNMGMNGKPEKINPLLKMLEGESNG